MYARSLKLITMTACLWAICGAVGAEEAPSFAANRIRASVTYTAPQAWDEDNGSDYEGFGLAGEHLFTEWVGLGFGAFTTEIDPWWGWRQDVRMTPITASALFHMTPGRPVDFYLGPGLAWVKFSGGDGGRELDDNFSPLFQIGFDVLPGDSPFGFNLDLKHIIYTGHNDPDFDSVTIAIGLVVRF
jgi:hypothetical protein